MYETQWHVFAIMIPASFIAALLTFYSGFGLGTLLMPVFAWVMPLQSAIACTAVVHLANNLFKAGLMGRYAHAKTLCDPLF